MGDAVVHHAPGGDGEEDLSGWASGAVPGVDDDPVPEIQELLPPGRYRMKRRKVEPDWPTKLADWYEAYPKCLRATIHGDRDCKKRPYSRGNFFCGEHGGNHPMAVKAAKRRYLMWALAGEPMLRPEMFETFMVLFTNALIDRMAGMSLTNQLKLLEIGASILKEGFD